jgi:Tfp pilus assembly PilM family ATPase
MGLPHWLTRNISHQPIAIHFGSDVIRLMQVKGSKECALQSAVEVASGDCEALKIALSSCKGKRCVVSIGNEDVLVQHIRLPFDSNQTEIRKSLVKHDVAWGDAEIRQSSVTTTGDTNTPRQELLCVGIAREKTRDAVECVESAGGEVIAVTVPLYASIRAFDRLYRRDGDEKITSLLIDMDDNSSFVMIAHGSNCVFAHRLSIEDQKSIVEKAKQQEIPSLTPLHLESNSDFERRTENGPRGLHSTESSSDAIEVSLESELEQCLRHHGALFPERAVDRVIFTGRSAVDTARCSSIASHLGIAGYVADPSAWVKGADGYAAGPAWTTVAGICIRYTERVA